MTLCTFPAAILLLPFLLLSVPSSACHFTFEVKETPLSERGLEDGLVILRRSAAEEPPVAELPADNGSFILAEARTRRKDPYNGFKLYTGGWNISDVHYWASVGFTAAPLFAIALGWFVVFGFVLLFFSIWFCCCRRRSYSYSRKAYAISLILLILFTCAAIIGCVVLYSGQGKFHRSTRRTLAYVVGQANSIVEKLGNFSECLGDAKQITVAQIFLPLSVQRQISRLEKKLKVTAKDLAKRTSDNSTSISFVLDKVRLKLIIIAAMMLMLVFFGFLFSIFGLQNVVSILVVIGWILVTCTFISCGFFLLLHNVVADTCVAVEEWVEHPRDYTAIDDILPCVDAVTANESLIRSREVTFRLVNVVNQVIQNVSNANFPPGSSFLYYNQSGPLMPYLCNPYTPDMKNRTCAPGELEFNNASEVWRGYVCQTKFVSGAEFCSTVGRVTPGIYNQMTAAVNVTRGLYYDVPFLTRLEDCRFAGETFATIHQNNCPGLERNSKFVFIGLVMVSTAVMLSLVFWVIYARERRHRKHSRQQFLVQAGRPNQQVSV